MCHGPAVLKDGKMSFIYFSQLGKWANQNDCDDGGQAMEDN